MGESKLFDLFLKIMSHSCIKESLKVGAAPTDPSAPGGGLGKIVRESSSPLEIHRDW